MFERSQFEVHDRRRRLEGEASRLRLVAQSAVPANHLMADPAWSLYQQQIAGAIEAMRKNEESALEKLANPRLVNHDAMMDAKVALAEIRATIHAWEVILALPKQIIADARKAEEILAEFGDRYAAEQA